MKDLASQEVHRYAPLWTGRYRGRAIAHSCNNEIQFHWSQPLTKKKMAPASGFAQEELAIHAIHDYKYLKRRLVASLSKLAGAP